MMIRVVVGPAREGRFSYKVSTEGTRLSFPMEGLSATPLFDACRRLKELGAAPDEAVVGMFNDWSEPDNRFRLRTTVGYGAKMTVSDPPQGSGVKFVPYTPPPEGGLSGRYATKEAVKSSEGTEIAPQAEKAVPDEGVAEAHRLEMEQLGAAARHVRDITRGVDATGAKSAKPEAAPPPPRTPPASPADTGPVPPKQPKRGLMHRKRKRVGSSGRRGQR